jgi:hypothetical protein
MLGSTLRDARTVCVVTLLVLGWLAPHLQWHAGKVHWSIAEARAHSRFHQTLSSSLHQLP